jgi:Mg-chelatase subunit ChlD
MTGRQAYYTQVRLLLAAALMLVVGCRSLSIETGFVAPTPRTPQPPAAPVAVASATLFAGSATLTSLPAPSTPTSTAQPAIAEPTGTASLPASVPTGTAALAASLPTGTASRAASVPSGTACTTPPARSAAPASLQSTPTGAVGAPGGVLFILDASSSMNEDDGSGHPKLDTAKAAMSSLADALPRGAPVGLRIYGDRVPDTDKANGCSDTHLVVPVGPLDPAAIKAAIDPVQAIGYTPISTSLEQAVGDLPADGDRTIVLVSDGEETCDRDPCQVVRDLADKGINVRIDTIGFRVDDSARKQLGCIASASGGEYRDASNAAELADSLHVVATRALKTYQTAGGVVHGGGSFNDAAQVQPGQYQDTLIADETLYYVINLSAGQQLGASATIVGQTDLQQIGQLDRAMAFKLTLYDTTRKEVNFDSAAFWGDTTESRATDMPAVSRDGTYYVSLSLQRMNSPAMQGHEFQTELLLDVACAQP